MTETIVLDFNEPFDWESMLTYLHTRGSAGVEMVDRRQYSRTVSLDDCFGWVTVTKNSHSNSLLATIAPSLLPKTAEVSARLRALFDLGINLQTVENVLGELARANPGLRIPGAFEPFEIVIRAILGQQISVKAATNLAGKLAARFGGKIETPYDGLNLLTPSPKSLAQAQESDLTSLGIMPARARTIIGFAREYSNGNITLNRDSDYGETVRKLTSLAGIGEWTAEYIAMRGLAYRDAFMHGDLGVKKALGESRKKALIEIAEKYRPWRAYATMHLWKSQEANHK